MLLENGEFKTRVEPNTAWTPCPSCIYPMIY